MDEIGCINIFLSEGAGVHDIVQMLEATGHEVPRDPFGHVKLDTINPGAYFAKQFADRIHAEKTMVQKSGYFSRPHPPTPATSTSSARWSTRPSRRPSRACPASSATTRSTTASCARSSSPDRQPQVEVRTPRSTGSRRCCAVPGSSGGSVPASPAARSPPQPGVGPRTPARMPPGLGQPGVQLDRPRLPAGQGRYLVTDRVSDPTAWPDFAARLAARRASSAGAAPRPLQRRGRPAEPARHEDLLGLRDLRVSGPGVLQNRGHRRLEPLGRCGDILVGCDRERLTDAHVDRGPAQPSRDRCSWSRPAGRPRRCTGSSARRPPGPSAAPGLELLSSKDREMVASGDPDDLPGPQRRHRLAVGPAPRPSRPRCASSRA